MRIPKRSGKLLLFAAVFVLILLLFYHCPFRYFFDIPCPGCGMTRALLAACTGDFEKAFFYHPLVPFFLPVGMYVWLRFFHGMRIPARQQTVYILFVFGAFVLVYLIRMMHGDPVLLHDAHGQMMLYGHTVLHN